jgi:hypothetical protein
MKPYKLQLVNALKSEGMTVRYKVLCEILGRSENDDDLAAKLILVTRRLSTSKEKWTDIIYTSGEYKSPS